MNNLNDLKVIDSIYNYKFYTHHFDPTLEIDKNPLFKLLFNPMDNRLLSLQSDLKSSSDISNGAKEEMISTSLQLLRPLLDKPLKIGADGCSSVPPAGAYSYLTLSTEFSKDKNQYTDYYQTFYNYSADIYIYIGTTLPGDAIPLSQEQVNEMLANSEIHVNKNKAFLSVNMNTSRVILTNLSTKEDFLEDVEYLFQEDFYKSLLNKDNPIDFFLSHGFEIADLNSKAIKYQGNLYLRFDRSIDEFLDILSLYKNCLRLEFKISDSVIFTFNVDTHHFGDPDVEFSLRNSKGAVLQNLGTSRNPYSCSWSSLNILSVISYIIRGEYAKECAPLLEIFIKKEILKEVL